MADRLHSATSKGATVVQGETGLHTYTNEEKEAFVDHINSQLKGDPHLTDKLPLNKNDDSLFQAVNDGILLCKLINAAVPGSIDERVINLKKNLNPWQRSENQQLVLNSAKAIGCKVVNIGPNDIIEGKPHLVLGLVWQIIKIGLLSKITLANHPQLVVLLREGETLEDLFSLQAEELLLRWFNYQLKKAANPRAPKQVANFTSDIKDSLAYTVVLNQVSPNKECDLSPLDIENEKERAEAMLVQADKINCRKFVTANDVVNANAKLNLAFVANLFNHYPALEEVEVDQSQYAALLEFNQEGTREERAFRFWIQSLGIDINNFYEDMADGIVLIKVIDAINEKGLVSWNRVNKVIKNKFNKVENCNYVVELCKKMGLSMVNIGGPDIVDKNKKLILGVVWQLMKQSIVNMLKQLSGGAGANITDNDMLDWANAKVKGAGRSSSITSFKDKSIGTGVFLCDLCYAVSPRSVNMELVTPGATPEEAEMNAKYAISVARKLGATIFLLWEDIVEVKNKMILTFVGSLMLVDKQQKNQQQQE